MGARCTDSYYKLGKNFDLFNRLTLRNTSVFHSKSLIRFLTSFISKRREQLEKKNFCRQAKNIVPFCLKAFSW